MEKEEIVKLLRKWHAQTLTVNHVHKSRAIAICIADLKHEASQKGIIISTNEIVM